MMKTKYLIIAVTLLAVVTVVFAEEHKSNGETKNNMLSETPAGEKAAASSSQESSSGSITEEKASDSNEFLTFILEQGPKDIRASELVGMPVYGTDGIQIARISDLILDPYYHITAVVMTSGDIFGIGGKRIAVSLNDLLIAESSSSDERSARVNLTEKEINKAPEFHSRGDESFLTVISTAPIVNRKPDGRVAYSFRFIANGCPKIQPAKVVNPVYLF